MDVMDVIRDNLVVASMNLQALARSSTGAYRDELQDEIDRVDAILAALDRLSPIDED